MDKFISIVDHTERTSTLSMEKDGLQVIGGLPHCTVFNPKTKEDAIKLIKYLCTKHLGYIPLPIR